MKLSKHLKNNNETYLSHYLFAGKIGINLIIRGTIFIIHAFLPFCEIPKKYNLETTAKKIKKWNDYTLHRTQGE